MNLAGCILVLCLLDICAGQTEEDASPEDRRLHKHKKKRRPYQQPYGAPCYDSGFLRDNGEGDQRSLFAALGGAAVGYHVGTKFPKQPIINNIYNGYGGGGGYGGAPCYPTQSHFGGLAGGLLGGHHQHHPILGSHGGHFGGGHFGGGHFGHHRQGVNWDRTIRQFERNVVRPISKWLK